MIYYHITTMVFHGIIMELSADFSIFLLIYGVQWANWIVSESDFGGCQ